MILESSRVALMRLIHSEAEIREAIDRAWVLRKLRSLFGFLGEVDLGSLVEASKVRRLKSGEVLFREGDAFDGMYLIRRGSMVITRKRQRTDRVVNYVPAGGHVGEFGLIDPSRRRSATVTAGVDAEAVRIPADALASIRNHSGLCEQFERGWRQRLAHDERMFAEPAFGQMLGFFISQGGKEATDLLVIDEELCVRCDNCETACAATHGGVSRLDRDGGPRFAGLHLPTACQHCENPLCMTDCPPGAIMRDPAGEVYIDSTCIGCGNCASFCNYGVISMDVEQPARKSSPLWSILFGGGKSERGPREGHEVAVKCDRCRELLGDEREGIPACVSACPIGAISRVKPLEFVQRLLAQLPRRVPEVRSALAEVGSGAKPTRTTPQTLMERADELLELAQRVHAEPDQWRRLIAGLHAMGEEFEPRGPSRSR